MFKRFIILLICIFVCSNAKSQMLCPLNLDFEEGYNNSNVYGWGLGFNSIDSGYKVVTTTEYYTKGLASAKIYSDRKTKMQEIGSFYQRINGEYYRNKTVRFSADVLVEAIIDEMLIQNNSKNDSYKYSFSEPCYLFINAKGKYGRTIAGAKSPEIFLRGWNLNQFAELTIPDNSIEITYGIAFNDTSTLYLDNCNLTIISNDSNYYTPKLPLSNIENIFLSAFTNIAGTLQYFHPSKNSIEANWNNIYLAGVHKAKFLSKEYNNISGNNLLQNISDELYNFFYPFCPNIKINYSKEQNNINPHFVKNGHNFDTNKYLLAYIHQGVPTKNTSSIVNINGYIKNSSAYMVQYVNIEAEQENVNISAFAKLEVPNGYKNEVRMYLRFEDEMGDFIGFSEIKKINIIADDWNKLELNTKIIDKTTKVLIIFEFQGYGSAFIDDVKCYTYDSKNNKNEIILKNSDFEKSLNFDLNNWLTTNETFSAKYRISYSNAIKKEGNQSVVMHSIEIPPYFVNKDSSIINFSAFTNEMGTINCQIPIYVEATTTEKIVDSVREINYITEPNVDAPILETGKPYNFSMNWKDRDSRLASAMILQNYTNHFGNYNEIFNLFPFAVCDSIDNYIKLLHSIIGYEKRNKIWNSINAKTLYSLPFQIEVYNDELYITNLLENMEPLHNGMKIISIENKNWKNYIGIDSNTNSNDIKNIITEKILFGELNNRKSFDVEINNEKISMTYFHNVLPATLSGKNTYGWHVFNDSILYIDLRFYSDKEISESFDSLKKFKHWIFDVRGDTKATELIISLFADSNYYSAGKLTPYVSSPFKSIFQVMPNFELIPNSKNKHIEGKVIFLISNNTYGYGELIAAAAKKQGQSILIGQQTQGAMITGQGVRLDSEIFFSIGSGLGFYPDNTSILQNPVTPDIEVNYIPEKATNDYILDAAINYLIKL